MKKIARFSVVKPEGLLVLDTNNPIFKNDLMSFNENLQEILPVYLPYTKVYEQIQLKNWVTIPKALMERLTLQYLHGASIIIDTPKRNFKEVYKLNIKPTSLYAYNWEDLDLSKPIPKSLANFKFRYNNKVMSYLQAVSTLKSTKYLPNEIWNALDNYSRTQIEKCKEYNQNIDYTLAEKWYNKLCYDCIKHNIKVFSPNEKTWYEVLAQIDFERDIKETRLNKGEKPLNDEQLGFLYTYAHIYGVEIPKLQWRFNYRKTPHHGYTQEIELVKGGMSTSDWEKVIFDYRNADKTIENGGNLPKNIRQAYTIKEEDCDKYLKDAYNQLKWLINNMGDEALMPGWHRCPECGKLYHEKDGCPCGQCPPLTQFEANNLFYGIPSAEDDEIDLDDEDEDWV